MSKPNPLVPNEDAKHIIVGCCAITAALLGVVGVLAAIFTVVVVSILWAASKFF